MPGWGWVAVLSSAFLGLATTTTAAPAALSQLQTTPSGPLVLGDQDTVEVTILAPETPETADRPLQLSVNVGGFGPVHRVSAGVYGSTYTLPTTRFPQVALVAVWRETGPEAQVDFHRIPLSARTELPIRARPGASVTVGVGETEVGPFEAPASGQLAVPLVIPPGVERVLVRSVRGQRQAQAWVPARVPPYNHLTLALSPHRVPADGVSQVRLHAYYDGEPPPLAHFQISGAEGKIEAMGLEGNRAIFRFVPRRSGHASQARLVAKIAREPTSSAEATLELGLPVPERAAPRPLPGPWLANGTAETTLSVLVSDRYGLGVAGLTVTASASPAQVLGTTDRGEGVYELRLRAPPRLTPDRQVHIQMRFGRSDAALALDTEVPLTAPEGAIDVRWVIEPATPIDPDEPFSVLLTPIDAEDRLVPDAALELTAEGARMRSIEPLGDGRLRARLDGASEAVTLVVTAPNLKLRIPIPVAEASGGFFVAPFLSGGYGGQLLLGGGLELGLRPGWLDGRLSLLLRGSYRFRQGQFFTSQSAAVGSIDATTHVIPVLLGLRYDFWADRPWRAYAHAAGGLVLGAHHLAITLGGLPLAPVDVPILGPAGEAGLGLSWSGLFLELSGAAEGASVEQSDRPRVRVPVFSGLLSLGYRFEVQ